MIYISNFKTKAIGILLVLVFTVILPNVFAKQILFVGDSIGAGYGIIGDNWIALANQQLKQAKSDYIIDNISLSGSTTSSGRQVMESYLDGKPDWDTIIIQLGGNDGLLGYPTTKIAENLTSLVDYVQSKQINLLLIGITLPPNYGSRRISKFRQIYRDIAKSKQVPLLMLDEIFPVEQRQKYIQFDNIHPNQLAQPILAEHLAQFIINSNK